MYSDMSEIFFFLATTEMMERAPVRFYPAGKPPA
jgi:hypothetical protein